MVRQAQVYRLLGGEWGGQLNIFCLSLADFSSGICTKEVRKGIDCLALYRSVIDII